MNPTELYQFFTTMIREGAEIIAAFLVGAVGVGYALWQFGFLGGHARCKQEHEETRGKLREAEDARGKAETHTKMAQGQAELAALKVQHLEKLLTEEKEKCEEEKKRRARAEEFVKQIPGLKKRAEEAETACAKANADLTAAHAARNEALEAIQAEKKAHEETTKECERQEKLKTQYYAAKNKAQEKVADLEKEVTELTSRVEKWETACRELEEKLCKAQEEFVKVRDKLVATEEELGKKIAEIHQFEDEYQKTVAYGGRIWERPLPANAPAFVPLGERMCPIIAVLNLKGGVGKTTITLNVAGTLAKQGKRVLMVDADFQRSLTSLCLRVSARIPLHQQGKTLQRYLLNKTWGGSSFRSCLVELQNMPGCVLMANTTSDSNDGLASAEDVLLLEWLSPFKCCPDVRFGLRAALHDPEISNQFDYILIDCPPRLSTACVNALVACDKVLIPVVPDAASATIPLPHLLLELRRLHEKHLFPEFGILGFVANRFNAGGPNLASLQEHLLKDVGLMAQTAWGKPIYRFKTPIRLLGPFTTAAKVLVKEEEHAVAAWESNAVKEMFDNLVTEILERVHYEDAIVV